MVGIVVISHSSKIAEGAIELAKEMAPSVVMVSAGGTSDKRIGTDMEKILEGINEVYSEDGVIVLFDLGSALMNAQMAVELLDEEMQKKVIIVDAALVEGTVVAAVQSSIGSDLLEIEKSLQSISLNKMQ
ncbi:dihydroxyacetone kinase phosphoryl donor subunit DhaM [Clostridium grantii]|uniref:phosphoenolpyruvate--glycerone phosphotransferase n=1 Tax=Clostridium grantii DSM 8605 TaxID=1121316 RepID=A0A1M5T1V4_9CLOT|nr:dihydroxyacetone kinase phosphoryl donor subunit DhaM [Clostridium grantii]SHH44695.1 dihydroxyacetone kinase DhaM subunit [Clostridium grantii DSM 8605]